MCSGRSVGNDVIRGGGGYEMSKLTVGRKLRTSYPYPIDSPFRYVKYIIR